MRWWLGFALLLLALGTLRTVGCGAEDVVEDVVPEPEYPRCLRDPHCDDHDACNLDRCIDGLCYHWEKPCAVEPHPDCSWVETRDCDPDTGVVECTWDTDYAQGQTCCNQSELRCSSWPNVFSCGWYCIRRGYCIDGACVDGNGYPNDCTDRDDARPCEVGDTIGLCWKGDCAVLDCTGLSSGTLCWFGGGDAGECRSGVVGDWRCFYAEPSGGGPPGWTCRAEYYGTGDGCDCGCGVIDLDCADGTVASCDYCALSGSCSWSWCEGIDPAQNWLCLGGTAVCGNDVVEAGELCDGTDLQGVTCADFGFTGGALACNATCNNVDTTGCTRIPAGWTCPPENYGTGDGCDCGCGVIDLDCADGTVASCDTCDGPGSCSGGLGCPGDIDHAQNWICAG